MVHHFSASAVSRHGDSGYGDSKDEELLPSLLPTPVELLSDDDFACRLISAINISSDDSIGDGKHGYADRALFENHDREMYSMSLVDKQSVVTKEVLARRWNINLDTAHCTLRATTQRGVRSFLNPTDRRLNTRLPYLSFSMLWNRKMYTDTLFAKVKSIRSNTCAQRLDGRERLHIVLSLALETRCIYDGKQDGPRHPGRPGGYRQRQ